MLNRVHLTTFGFEYGPPPEHADRVYDVRDTEDFPKDGGESTEARAEDIMRELNPGDNIAIGCDFGHDRSPYIAKVISDNYPGVDVEHRDYDKHEEATYAATQGKKQSDRRGEHPRDAPQRLPRSASSGSRLTQSWQRAQEGQEVGEEAGS